jgi:DNA-binding transcriptional MerR regulator
MTEPAEGDYLTLEEAADLLKINPRTLLRYEDERGLIVSRRLPGGGRRYIESEVRALLRMPEQNSTSDAGSAVAS